LTTTSELENEIESCIDATGCLVLPGAALGSATMAAAFEQYLTDDSLIVHSAVIRDTDESVTVTGEGGGRFSGLSVTAVFTPTDSGDVAVVVSGMATDGWLFSFAFDSLAGGVYDSVPVASGSILVLRSLADGDVSAGLWFDGALLTSGVISGIAPFLNGSEPIAVSGTVGVISGIPGFSFNAAVKQDMTVGTLTGLNFTLNAVSTYSQDAYLSLGTPLTFNTKSGSMTVTAEMRFDTEERAYLVATLDESPGILLAYFMDWAGGDLWAGMPDISLFDPSDYLTLNTLNFCITLASGALDSFDLGISTQKGWEVIPDLMTVTLISQTLTSVAPSETASITGSMVGMIDLGDGDGTIRIKVGATTPDFTFFGGLEDGCVVNAAELVASLIPAAVDIPAITLTQFEFTCQPSNLSPTYSIAAAFETDWVLDISPIRMAVTNASIDIAYGPSDEGGETGADVSTGGISGTIVFNNTLSFDIAYAIPGEFDVRGEIARLSLSESIARLVDMEMPLPNGFDLVFTDCSVAICYGSGADATTLEFQIGADVQGLGTLAFDALKVGSEWGYVTGLSMGSVSLSDVPGLSVLKPFDAYFFFKQLVLVVSTATLENFDFPEASVFDGGASSTSGIALPAAQGIVAGMNAYADINLTSQSELLLLKGYLYLPDELSITLQVGLEDVEAGSYLYVAIAAEINSNLAVDGSFGAKLEAGMPTPELYMTGNVATQLQGENIVFDFTLAFVYYGAFMSGGYTGTIDFVICKVSNLFLEIGVDWAGDIISIGYAAQIDTVAYESSVMILLNSAVPTQSMFVASISDLNLATTLRTLCNLTDTNLVPESLMSVLERVGLSGTNRFTLDDPDGAVADSLNERDVAAVSQAFAVAGIALPDNSAQVIISVADSGALWHVTDMVNVLQYSLVKSESNATIGGALDAQLYVVPQDTQLGNVIVPEGFRLNGSLDLFGFTSTLTVYISDSQGLWIEAGFSRMIINVSGNLIFSFTSSDGKTGPTLSVCTYQNNQASDPDKQPPHFFANGAINVLGVLGMTVTMNFTETGGNFEMTVSQGGAYFSLGGSYSDAYKFSTDGSADVGVDATLDFGSIGRIHVVTSVGYLYEIAVTSPTSVTAGASGHFDFEGIGFDIPGFTLDLSADSLANLANDAVNDVEKYLAIYLADFQQWLNWLYDGIILGVDTAEQVGEILAGTYELGYETIAIETTEILHYGSDQVAKALDGAGATADESMDILVNTLDYSVDEATKAVEDAFSGVHCDVSITPHGDSGIPHGDTGTPHGDSAIPHGDSTVVPHGDSTVTPHSDSKPHTDSKVMGIHTDIKYPHTDIPKTHADTPAVHGDTPSVHTDAPEIHADTPSVHTDVPAIHTDITT
jgi:hypothetical protein